VDQAENHESNAWLRYHEVSPAGTKVLSRIENFIEPSCSIAFLVGASSPLIGVVSELFQDEPVLFKDKMNMKPPGGGAYTVHQDAPAYRGFGITDFITAMIAVDEATVENGCLEFAAGPRITRELEVDGDGQIIAAEIAGMQFEPTPVRSGDAIVFDGLVPHRSAPNRSGLARRALFLTFNPKKQGEKRSEYYEAKRRLFPPQDQREPDLDYRKIGRQFNLGNPFV
jgi:ectoine hydroxylase-related dioxygenase (phytanoyl-CoA dioxygenase family)